MTRLKISQIYPELDIAWQERLMHILAQEPEETRQLINTEMLIPRGIVWDRQRNLFHHRADPVDLRAFTQNACHPRLQPFAQWCCNAVEQLKHMDSATEIADLLENVIEKITALSVEEDADLGISKRGIHKKFIFAAAASIKAKMQLKIPDNLRNINTSIFKSFVNEVFLKQQLLDYWFRVLRSRQLMKMSHPLLNDYLRKEQKLRKLEITQTSQYIFAIATTYDESVNIFSIRRFLHEETIAHFTYINCAYIKNDFLDEPRSVRAFKNQISLIVSIGGKINETLVNAVEKIEADYENVVYRELFLPLETGNVTLGAAVAKKLHEYEKSLKREVLNPLKKAATRLCTHTDDFNYLFISLMQIIGDAIADFRDFQLKPAVMENTEVDRFMIRMLSYIKLVKKRKSSIFNASAVEEWESSNASISMMFNALRTGILQKIKTHTKLKAKHALLQQALTRDYRFWEKLLGIPQRKEKRYNSLGKSLLAIQRMMYMDALNILTKNKDFYLHVEQNSPLFMSKRRGYALCNGSNGLDTLPLLLIIPDSYRDFHPDEVLQDIFPSVEKFPDSGHT